MYFLLKINDNFKLILYKPHPPETPIDFFNYNILFNRINVKYDVVEKIIYLSAHIKWANYCLAIIQMLYNYDKDALYIKNENHYQFRFTDVNNDFTRGFHDFKLLEYVISKYYIKQQDTQIILSMQIISYDLRDQLMYLKIEEKWLVIYLNKLYKQF